ncbi:conserved hypothetical protein [Candida dubliniensis CD36]|uniref:Uncharacterized protein n=1 Tax=Candida dubliniensis (strain CD36 / ATCC MYA-646 / CBS 7987 / NCPF 3949 / NRRL Y-17841) TaxID=573826 RepID=B9WI88_CANDC|nr:conserved hypothetical protein [Candida dubliniensis CD36]CAX41885.1 conserved hypothetical protein [Candida dubliniensis CD36]
MAYTDEIQLYKTKLDALLAKKYIDQSLLIGVTASLQAKFHGWIVTDLERYRNNLGQPFRTIDLFETLWVEFHSPIIKFFQQQHGLVFEGINEHLKECQREGKPGSFKVRPVEMRKINESFIKFIKEVFGFYSKLLKYFVTHYRNAYLPRKFMEPFGFVVDASAVYCDDDNFQANVLYLVHRCCLSLGDIHRHRTFIETSFVTPSSSNREYFRVRSTTDKTFLLPAYAKALQYYHLCIMLLPALNEPYNHIGVIYNLVDEKFTAVYWFLRSQFTRIPDYKLGHANMTKILQKHWFTTALVDIVRASPERHFSATTIMNVYLVCLIGYVYCPERYKSGPNIVKKIAFSKVETDFFKMLEKNFDGEVVLRQLVVAFSFLKLDRQEKLVKFTFRFVERVLDCLRRKESLVVLRFLLNVLRENPEFLGVFQARRNCMVYLCGVLNKYYQVVDHRPTRGYYFWEDVHFRDFSLIKYQFKDFNDEEIFAVNNVDVLVGDHALVGEVDEDDLRAKASVCLGKKILGGAQEYEFKEDGRFSIKKRQEKAAVVVPQSLEEIQSFITNQAKELSMDIDQGLQDMVNALVED